MTVDVSDLERLDRLAGYKQGIKNGKRLAKRKSEWPKSLNPPNMTKCYQTGYELGIKNGRRLEKGKSEFPQLRGHPKALFHDLLVLQFINFVDNLMRKKNISLPGAVSRYRDVFFGRAWKKLKTLPPWLQLNQEQLLNLYKRKAKPEAISDDVHRIYNLLQFGSLDSPNT
jgi:hypothetical protein